MPAISTSSSRPYVSRRKRSRSSEPSKLSTKATLGMLSLLVVALLASLAVIAASLTSDEPNTGSETASATVIDSPMSQ